LVHAVIEQIQPGEVLVLSMPDPRPIALIGELLATQVKVRRAAAILVDAAVRDVDELVNLGLPIWTRYIRVKAAGKSMAGMLNVPVTVGGTRISPGEIVVLDSDGALCIQCDRAEAVLQAAEARFARETQLRDKLLAGELTIDLHGLRKILE
jgi:4-hydroxy-4-methyl-2-oxoglutarate aldolase